ncbi:MAG: hypothetical protein HYZ14_15230 [Bacteroidetes bacterium]|nr:hypothetical protein [Bacteroidota bacterium]
MKTVIAALILIITSTAVSAQTKREWTGASDNAWSNPANWLGNIPPVSGDTIIIHAGPVQPYLTTAFSVSLLQINAGASLTLGSQKLTVLGDWSNQGTFNAGTSTVLFAGSILQFIKGDQTFYNLEVNNTNGLQIYSGYDSLRGVLTLTNGNFETSDRLFILSDSTGTGSIGPITGGSISGNINVHRYLDITTPGWRFLSSPVANATLNEINDDFYTYGFPGSAFPADTFISVYYYNETYAGMVDSGFVAAGTIDDSLPAGTGFIAHIDPSNLDGFVDFTGPANTGTINLPVSYTVSGVNADGWNLVGNPYPSAINWDDTTIVKTGIDNAIYMWNPALGAYASYVDGIGTNGGKAVIASSQAFYVRANSPSPVLQLTENCKTTLPSYFFKSETGNTPFILNVSNSYGQDQTVLKINDAATLYFDAAYDAHKMFPHSANQLSIFSSTQNLPDTYYSINQFSEQAVAIPIYVTTTSSEIHTLTFSGAEGFVHSSCVFLEDLVTGITYDLSVTSQIDVFIADTTSVPRFLLKLGAPVYTEAFDASCYAQNDGAIHFAKQSEELYDLSLFNQYGTLLTSQTDIYQIVTLENLDAGIYIIQCTDSLCGNLTDSLVVSEPAHITAQFSSSADTVYFDGTPEEISFTNESLNASYYLWDCSSMGTCSAAHSTYAFDTPGTYAVTLTAYQNSSCYETAQRTITVIDLLNTEEMTLSQTNVYAASGQLNVYTEQSGRIELRDFAGRLILDEPVAAGNTVISLTAIPQQVLLVSVICNDTIYTKKISSQYY